MHLIPEKTKGKNELMLGITIGDVIVSLIAAVLLVLVLLSSLPGRSVVCVCILLFCVVLLVRLDGEPNYQVLLKMLRFFALPGKFERVYSDEMLMDKESGKMHEEVIESYRKANEERMESEGERETEAKEDPAQAHSEGEDPKETEETENAKEATGNLIESGSDDTDSNTAEKNAEESEDTQVSMSEEAKPEESAEQAKSQGQTGSTDQEVSSEDENAPAQPLSKEEKKRIRLEKKEEAKRLREEKREQKKKLAEEKKAEKARIKAEKKAAASGEGTEIEQSAAVEQPVENEQQTEAKQPVTTKTEQLAETKQPAETGPSEEEAAQRLADEQRMEELLEIPYDLMDKEERREYNKLLKKEKKRIKQELKEENKLLKEEKKQEKAEIAAEKKRLKEEKKALRKQIMDEEEILHSKTATQEEIEAVKQVRQERQAEKERQQAEIEEQKRLEAEEKQREKEERKEEKTREEKIDAFMDDISAFTDIREGFLEFADKYYGKVIEIEPVSLRFYDAASRRKLIDKGLGKVFLQLPSHLAANIIKIERPLDHMNSLMMEFDRLAQIDASFEEGLLSEKEWQARKDLQQKRIRVLKDLGHRNRVMTPFYYLALFDKDKRKLEKNAEQAAFHLGSSGQKARIPDTKQLAIFSKYCCGQEFDEKEIDNIAPEDYAQWAQPQTVRFRAFSTEVNGMESAAFCVSGYPMMAHDAYLAGVMSIPDTKVVVKCTPVAYRRAVRDIDRTLQRLTVSYRSSTTASRQNRLAAQIEVLKALQQRVMEKQERLMDVNIYVTAYDTKDEKASGMSSEVSEEGFAVDDTAVEDVAIRGTVSESISDENVKKEIFKKAKKTSDADPEKEAGADANDRMIVDMIDPPQEPAEKIAGDDHSKRMSRIEKQLRRIWKEEGFRLRRMDFDQFTGYAGSQVSGYDPLLKKARSIPCNTLAASIPWAYPRILEDGGSFIGVADQVPVFVDFFRPDEQQIRSNVLLAGRDRKLTGQFAENLLSELAATDARIFAFDTENRFRDAASKTGGSIVAADDTAKCRINPFQIVLLQSGDEKKSRVRDGVIGDFATHLYFLDGFFKLLLKDLESDVLEYLGSLIEKTYHEKGIYADTDLTMLRLEDYPVFDDLYAQIQMEFVCEKNEYLRSMLKSLVNHISKFAAGGRNGGLWNGPTTCSFDSSFTTYDFSSMIDSGNQTLAAAQFMLILRMLMGSLTAQEEMYEKLKKNEEEKGQAEKNDENELLSEEVPRPFWQRPAIVWIGLADEFLSDQDPALISSLWQIARKLQKDGGMLVLDTKSPGAFVQGKEMETASSALLGEFSFGFFSALPDGELTSLDKLLSLRGGIRPEEQQVLRRLTGDEMAGFVRSKAKFIFHAAYPDDTAVDEDRESPQEEMIAEYMPELKELYEDMQQRRRQQEKAAQQKRSQAQKKTVHAGHPEKERSADKKDLRDPDGPNEDKLLATLEQILSEAKTSEDKTAEIDENSKHTLTISQQNADQIKAEPAGQQNTEKQSDIRQKGEKESTDDGVRDAILQLNETLKAMQQFMSGGNPNNQ